MHSKEPIFYKESSQLDLTKFLLAYLFCFFISMPLGYIYTLLIVVIPLVYVRGLITVGVALLLAYTIRFLGRITHNRNLKSRYWLIIGFVVSLSYFQWVAFIIYFYNERMPSFGLYFSNIGMLFSPQDVLSQILEINKFGAWEVFGMVLNGGLLGFIWIVEFFIFLCIPILNIKNTRVYPYSEEQGTWYKKYTLEEDYKVVGSVAQLTKDLHHNALKTIQELGYGTGNRFAKVHVFYMKRSTYHYLDVEKVTIDREGKEERSLLVGGLRIDNKTAASLLDNFGHQQERIAII